MFQTPGAFISTIASIRSTTPSSTMVKRCPGRASRCVSVALALRIRNTTRSPSRTSIGLPYPSGRPFTLKMPSPASCLSICKFRLSQPIRPQIDKDGDSNVKQENMAGGGIIVGLAIAGVLNVGSIVSLASDAGADGSPVSATITYDEFGKALHADDRSGLTTLTRLRAVSAWCEADVTGRDAIEHRFRKGRRRVPCHHGTATKGDIAPVPARRRVADNRRERAPYRQWPALLSSHSSRHSSSCQSSQHRRQSSDARART